MYVHGQQYAELVSALPYKVTEENKSRHGGGLGGASIEVLNHLQSMNTCSWQLTCADSNGLTLPFPSSYTQRGLDVVVSFDIP